MSITLAISSGEPICLPPTARPAFRSAGVGSGSGGVGPGGGRPFGRGVESRHFKKETGDAPTFAFEERWRASSPSSRQHMFVVTPVFSFLLAAPPLVQ